MHDETDGQIGRVVERIFQLAARDAELRQDLHAMARAILDYVEHMENGGEFPPRGTRSDIRLPEFPGSFCQSFRGGSFPDQEASSTSQLRERAEERPVIDDGELRLMQERAELKADAVEWCIIDRFGADEEVSSEEMEARKREMIEHARSLPDCYLWMLYRWTCGRGDERDWEALLECFQNLAEITKVLQNILPHEREQRELMEQGVKLTAEVQSALRTAVETVGNRMPDPDQEKAFLWLRRTTEEQRVFVERFMRWNDRADPLAWAETRARLEALDEQIHTVMNMDQEASKILNKARYHVKMVERAISSDHDHDWRQILDAVESVLKMGMPPDSAQLRDLLIPVIQSVPEIDGEHEGFDEVLREISEYMEREQTGLPERLAPELSGDAGRPTKWLEENQV